MLRKCGEGKENKVLGIKFHIVLDSSSQLSKMILLGTVVQRILIFFVICCHIRKLISNDPVWLPRKCRKRREK